MKDKKTKTKAKEMMKWLLMWDKPDTMLVGNKILPNDLNVDREVEKIFRQNMNLSVAEFSVPG